MHQLKETHTITIVDCSWSFVQMVFGVKQKKNKQTNKKKGQLGGNEKKHFN